MKTILFVDDELSLLSLQRQVPSELQVNGIDAPKIFMNRAGIALKKALQKERLAEPLREKK